MKNYHTHTKRCGHASGEDREYVEAAIEAGFEVLGFSDHGPMIFPNNHYSGFRMQNNDVEGYVKSVRALQEEYKDQITIKLGFELEYYPELFDRTLEFIKPFEYDYLILGQHYIYNEYDKNAFYCGGKTYSKKNLDQYINQALEGLKTGEFAYIAHPDLIKFKGSSKYYIERMTYFCQELKKLGYPLEFNKYGYTDKRNYPDMRFWKLAAEAGNTAIVGFDAHWPDFLKEIDVYNEMVGKIDALGMKRTEEISFRR